MIHEETHLYIFGLEARVKAQDAQIAALQAERDGLATEVERLRAALKQIADGNPAPPGGKWLSDAKMAQIARSILSTVEAAS